MYDVVQAQWSNINCDFLNNLFLPTCRNTTNNKIDNINPI